MRPLLFILFLIPALVGAQEATDTMSGVEETVESSEEQCSRFLESFRQSVLPIGEERLKEFRKKGRLFGGDPRACQRLGPSCEDKMAKELSQAEELQDKYLEYRLAMGINLRRSRRGGDRGFQFPTQFKTSVGTPVFTGELSGKMRKRIIKRLNSQQGKHYHSWFKQRASGKYKNWKKCIPMRGKSQVQMRVVNSRSGHYAPQFHNVNSLPTDIQSECKELKSFVKRNQISHHVLKKFKEEREKKWRAFRARIEKKKKFPEWVHYADKRLRGIKSKKKRAQLVASTYNGMDEELRSYVRGTGGQNMLSSAKKGGLKEKDSYSNRELWEKLGSVDSFQSTLKKNCPKPPSMSTWEMAKAGAKMVIPGAGLKTRADAEFNNRAMALLGVKSPEEADEDWNAIHNQSVADGAAEFVPGGKALKFVGVAVGRTAFKTVKNVAPKTTERLQNAAVRALSKGRVKANKKFTAVAQRVLQKMKEKGFPVDKVDDWAAEKATGVATGVAAETVDESAEELMEKTAINEYVETVFKNSNRARPLNSIEKKIISESSKQSRE